MMCLAPWAAAAAAEAAAALPLRARVFQGTHEELADVVKRMNRYGEGCRERGGG
jgi:hypothetical protein